MYYISYSYKLYNEKQNNDFMKTCLLRNFEFRDRKHNNSNIKAFVSGTLSLCNIEVIKIAP